MPKYETIFQVFVASPGDVAEERAGLEEVIRELNDTWSQRLQIRLDLLRWETHAFPAFGEDAQDVINRQIPDDYDVFIGIMWTRFGTPTGRAESGTEEEFNRAYERYKNDPESVRLMLYFKDAPIARSNIDPTQLSKIRSFRSRIPEKGGLYWTFTSFEEFQGVVRIHLSRLVQEWSSRLTTKETAAPGRYSGSGAVPATPPSSSGTPEIAGSTADSEDLGFLDLIELANKSFTGLQEVLERMTEAILTLTDKFNRRNQELSELVLQRSQDVEAWKSMTNRLAEDMEEFVTRTRNEIPIFSDMLKNGFEALGKTMSLSLDFAHPKPTELEAAGALIADLRSKLASGQQPVSDFREIIGRIPRMSKAINRAKRKTLETLDLLLSHVVSGEKMARELEASIRALACKQDPSTAQ